MSVRIITRLVRIAKLVHFRIISCLNVEINRCGMSNSLVDKLLESFDELDKCIEMTKGVLAQKDGVPMDVVHRVDQYSEIVSKQRNLTSELTEHISSQNWDEVGRHVKLINGLSGMIRDDAQSILTGAYNDQDKSNKLDLLA